MRTIITALLFLSLTLPAFAMPICGNGKRINCVVDGDTLWLNGEKFRLLAIDTPEMGPPKCRAAAPLAAPARDRLADFMDQGTIGIERNGVDKFGRTLATISIGGQDVGALLLSEGLARVYVPGEAPWCN